MGKIYPLSKKASCYEATIQLIEKSFQYQPGNSFEKDFAPLIDKSNHHNCYILLDENEQVVAHIGVKEKNLKLGNRIFPVMMIGGIAVDDKHRGKGHFQTLFQDVLAEKRSDTTFFLLWSDLEKLYSKYGFHLCGTQFEFQTEKKTSPFIKTKLQLLNKDEQKQIKNLFETSFAREYLTLMRNDTDWELISKINSADLFILKEGDNISEYYFQNKGQDLPDIIYEYGSKNDISELIQKLGAYGKVWMGKAFVPTENLQYQFFMAPGDNNLFSEFINKFTGGKFEIRNINLMKQEVYFDFNEETLSLELCDFLRGVFGPGTFEELELPTLFLSGLESI
jgi:predicted GNAT family N-acyltransferase